MCTKKDKMMANIMSDKEAKTNIMIMMVRKGYGWAYVIVV
jgi:hypothetical protein